MGALFSCCSATRAHSKAKAMAGDPTAALDGIMDGFDFDRNREKALSNKDRRSWSIGSFVVSITADVCLGFLWEPEEEPQEEEDGFWAKTCPSCCKRNKKKKGRVNFEELGTDEEYNARKGEHTEPEGEPGEDGYRPPRFDTSSKNTEFSEDGEAI